MDHSENNLVLKSHSHFPEPHLNSKLLVIQHFRGERSGGSCAEQSNCTLLGTGQHKPQVKGLENNTEYEFRIRAKNVAGLGNPSDSTGPVQVKPKYVKPSTPGVPEAAKIGRTFVELKWDKPRNDGGSKITGYVVEKREKGMNLWSKANEFPVVDNFFTVTGLPENSEFEFRIAALNAAGTGEPSLPCAPIKIKEKIKGHERDEKEQQELWLPQICCCNDLHVPHAATQMPLTTDQPSIALFGILFQRAVTLNRKLTV
ncbi:Twitchin [Bulinus truncatus]|nr:Twitchin [Bulinus truncatus]